MFDKYKIAIVIVAALALGAVAYRYAENYIVVEAKGIYIKFPAKPDDAKLNNTFEPANIATGESDTNTSKVIAMAPSNKSNIDKESESKRVFDDVMKVVETVTPLAVVLIPIYLQKRNKRKQKDG